ncbi:Uncharacterised protein g5937 [Pycnogonum litorale]
MRIKLRFFYLLLVAELLHSVRMQRSNWWSNIGRTLSRYRNVFTDLADADNVGRIFKLDQDYVITVILELIFSPNLSGVPIVAVRKFGKSYDSSSRRSSSFIEQVVDMVTYNPEVLARSFFTQTIFSPTIEFGFPAPIRIPSFYRLFGRNSGKARMHTANNSFDMMIYKYAMKPLFDADEKRIRNFVSRALPEFSKTDFKNLYSLGRDIGSILDIDENDPCTRRYVGETLSYFDDKFGSFAKPFSKEMLDIFLGGSTKNESSRTPHGECKSSILEKVVSTSSNLIQKLLF